MAITAKGPIGAEILELDDGAAAGLSSPNTIRLRANIGTGDAEVSAFGGAYTSITGGGGPTAIQTGDTVWVDSVNGNDGTGLSGRQDKPFLTIGAALVASAPGDLVAIRPGSYSESIVVPTGVSLIGLGGPERTLVTGTAGFDTVTLSDGCYVQGIGATAPSGSTAFAYAGASLCYLYNAMMTGTDLTSVGFAHVGTGKIIVTELRYVGGDFDAFVHHANTGILALTGMHVPGGGTINSCIRASLGARLQLNDINSGNPLVTDAIECADATIIMRSSALFNCANGLHITDNAANVQWASVRFDSTSAFDILVDPALTGVGGTVNLTACELQEGKLSIPATWLASDHNWTFQDAKSDIDNASFRAFTDLTVGHREKGFATDLGQGCPSARGMVVITTDSTASAVSDGGTLTDVSTAAQSKAGSTFTFQGVAANHTILFGSSLQDIGGALKAWGAEFVTDTARAGGAIVAEIWDGAAWVPIGAAECQSFAPHATAGPDLFLSTSDVQIRLGIEVTTTWAAKAILGNTLFWFRLRVSVAMAVAPIFEQSKLHPSCTRTGTDGVVEFFGTARQRLDQGLTLRDTDDLNGISPGNVDIAFGSLGGFVLTADVLDNNFQNAGSDGNSLVWPISPNVDTSLPITFRIWWIPDTAGAGDVLWQLGHRAIGPGSTLNSGQALDGVESVAAATPAALDELLFTDIVVDISATSAGSGLLALGFIRDGGDAADTYGGDAEVVGIQLLAYQWRI